MKRTFIDTSALVALFDQRDKHHKEAKEALSLVQKKKIRLLISDYIFDESITTVLSHAGHEVAEKVGEFILSSNILEFISLNLADKMNAWEYFKKHSDKGYSYTDCTSFILMKEKKINCYFAFGDHFHKAGFSNFLRRFK